MNNIKTSAKENHQVDSFKKVLLVCPECRTQKDLKVPSKIIEQSQHVITISIPTGLVCEHHFQAFVDKNCDVRGYQLGDFEFSKLEYYESSDIEGEQEDDDDISEFTSLPLFQEIINLLRDCVDDKEILGCAIFTTDGKVIYSSIPQNTLLNTIREFELREQNKLSSIRRMLIELDDEQKICSQYMRILGVKFILVLLFSSEIRLGMGIVLMSNLARKIEELI